MQPDEYDHLHRAGSRADLALHQEIADAAEADGKAVTAGLTALEVETQQLAQRFRRACGANAEVAGRRWVGPYKQRDKRLS